MRVTTEARLFRSCAGRLEQAIDRRHIPIGRRVATPGISASIELQIPAKTPGLRNYGKKWAGGEEDHRPCLRLARPARGQPASLVIEHNHSHWADADIRITIVSES